MKKLITPLKRDIIQLWQELYISPDSSNELDNYVQGKQPCASIKKLWTYDVVHQLTKKKSSLEEERDRRRRALHKAVEHIHELWGLLKIGDDDEDKRKFLVKKDAQPPYSLEQIAVVRKSPRHL